MALNDKLLQLKDNINSLKQELTNAVVNKGGNVSESNSFSEIINNVNDLKLKWFDGLKILSSVNDSQVENIMSGCDFSEVSDFEGFLRDRSSFTTFPSFDTSKAKNLNNLFRNCTGLVSLPYFDVSNAESIEGMIEGCTSLETVGGFGGLKQDFKFVMNSKLSHDSLMNIINNLATVSGKQLAIGQNNRDKLSDEEVAIATQKGWNVVVKLPYVSGLFANDSTTTDDIIDNVFQGYDTANRTNLYGLFIGCSSITRVPKIDSSNVENTQRMFANCSSLTEIPLFDTSQTIYMNAMFANCSSLTTIPLFDFSKSINTDGMFSGCTSLTTIPEINFSNVTSCSSLFENCSSLITIPKLNFSNVTKFSYLFSGCISLTKITELDTLSADSVYYMFKGCTNLRYILLKNLGTKENISSFNNNMLNDTKWGVEDESIPESAGARQSMIDSMITYSYDRATAGYSPLTYSLSSASKAVLTEEEIAAVTAKGYTIA